jgi:hypothetical protein
MANHDILDGKKKPEGKTNVIHIKKSHEGLLHKNLGVGKSKKLTDKELQEAKHSKNPAERKRAQFAINAKKWAH